MITLRNILFMTIISCCLLLSNTARGEGGAVSFAAAVVEADAPAALLSAVNTTIAVIVIDLTNDQNSGVRTAVTEGGVVGFTRTVTTQDASLHGDYVITAGGKITLEFASSGIPSELISKKIVLTPNTLDASAAGLAGEPDYGNWLCETSVLPAAQVHNTNFDETAAETGENVPYIAPSGGENVEIVASIFSTCNFNGTL